MTIEEATKDFLKKLSIYSEVIDEDLDLSYQTDILETFNQNVSSAVPSNSKLEFLFDEIISLIDDGSINIGDRLDDYIKIKNCEIKFLSRQKETKFRIRNFAISTESGAIIPLKLLDNLESYPISEIEKAAIRRAIRELILFTGKSTYTQDNFNRFIKRIIEGKKNSVIAIYNTAPSNFVKLCSKTYFLYLLKGQRTIFPNEIKHEYSPHQNFIESVNRSNEDFTQFFEIYDVIDEYHHSNDILVKYLKMYQIIEYLLTRTILVRIQSNNSNQNLFLREINSLSKFDDFDKKHFKTVFSSEQTDLTSWFQSKLSASTAMKNAVDDLLFPNLDKSLNLGNPNEVYNGLVNLIYQLRNTIVHNKESEIHLTIHNIQLRQPIIRIIKELLQKLEKIIFEKVVNFDASINYSSKYLELY